MQYYRCKCGFMAAWTSMGVPCCSWCEKCESDLAPSSDMHNTKRIPHEMTAHSVQIDAGHAVLSRCRWCMRTRKELEGQPMEDEK